MVAAPAPPSGPVPELRGELAISFRGTPGAASALIYDPLSHRYFELSHDSTVLIQNWSLQDPAAIIRAAKAIGVSVTDAAIEALSKFLVENGLVKHPGARQGFTLWHKQRAQKKTLMARFSRLIFLRIPLGNPDPMLGALYSVVWPLLTRAFTALTMGAFLCALWLLSHMPEAISANFKALISLQGAPTLLIALALVKLGHELGHGLQAKRLGLRVPSGGIMFLLGLPLPFVELSSAWQLEQAKDRIRVDAGGILAESAIAAWSLLAFCFWPDGTMRLILFAMASSSLALSLLVNLNPLMRFDGYFLLSDLLGIKNLQPRSLALMKWRLREILFNLSDPVPEAWPLSTRRWLIVYGVLLTLYRVSLYLGIAILAYTVLNKLFGVAVFVFQILFFVGLPILRELRVWWTRRRDIAARRRVWISGAVFAGLIILLALPMPRNIMVPARLSNVQKTDFFAPRGGVLEQVRIADGQHVRAEDTLWEFHSPRVTFERQAIQSEIAAINSRIARLAAETGSRSEAPLLISERDRLQAERSSLDDAAAKLRVATPVEGTVRADAWSLPDQVHDQIALPGLAPLGTVLERQAFVVTAFIPSHALSKLPDTLRGVYMQGPEARLLGLPRKADLTPIQIDDAPIQRLTAPEMSSSFGGMIKTDPADPQRPQDIWFSATSGLLDAPEFDYDVTLSGHVVLRAERASFAARAFNQIAQTLVLHIGN